jgi:hypothetical protein
VSHDHHAQGENKEEIEDVDQVLASTLKVEARTYSGGAQLAED